MNSKKFSRWLRSGRHIERTVPWLFATLAAIRLSPLWIAGDEATVAKVVEAVSDALLLTAVAYISAGLYRHIAIRDNRITLHTNAQDLYRAFASAVDEATDTVRTTHVRNAPMPVGISANADFQQMLLDWVRKSPNARLKRLISSRATNSQAVQKIITDAGSHANYVVAKIDWPLDTPMINFVTCDDRYAFVCLYRDRDHERSPARIWGMRIEDEEIVRLINEYLDALWNDKHTQR